MTKGRVWITRAEPGASQSAERLAALGYEPIVQPLFAVVPIAATPPAFDALAFTSANGVRQFAGLTARRDVPVFAVGGRTAGAAREAGFGNVRSAEGDVSDVIRLIASSLAPGARLLHAGNEDSRGDLAGALTAQGFFATHLAIYRAQPVTRPPPILERILAGAPAPAILLFSPRGAAILAGFLDRPINAKAAAISAATAEPVRDFMTVAVAESPDENALFRTLDGLAGSLVT